MQNVLASADDYQTYLAVRSSSDRTGPGVRVRCKPTGDWPILLRPGTTDARVLEDTFAGLYHLPPIDLPADAVILDLGANIGLTAMHYARAYPSARIVCVEMDAGNVEALKQNVRAIGPRVSVIHAAVWYQDTHVSYGGQEEWGFAVSEQWGDRPAATSTTPERRVEALSIGTIMARAGVRFADFVKLDIEGAEAQVLAHKADWLSRFGCLQVEVHAPCTIEHAMDVLNSAGLRVWKDTKHWSCVLAVNEALRRR
jgi:FkbM family methyltransferase